MTAARDQDAPQHLGAEQHQAQTEGVNVDEVTRVDGQTMLEHVGGVSKVRDLAELFHAQVLEDDLLHDLFVRSGSHTHAAHLTHFLEEIMGGRKMYTDLHEGVQGLFEAHRDLSITEEQRQRFVEIMVATLELVEMPTDQRFRESFSARIDQGSHFSKNLSQPGVEPFPAWPPVGTWGW